MYNKNDNTTKNEGLKKVNSELDKEPEVNIKDLVKMLRGNLMFKWMVMILVVFLVAMVLMLKF